VIRNRPAQGKSTAVGAGAGAADGTIGHEVDD